MGRARASSRRPRRVIPAVGRADRRGARADRRRGRARGRRARGGRVSSLATSDVDVGAVLLQTAGAKLGKGSLRVDQRITDGRLTRTMDGASTLELMLDDHDRALLRSGAFSRQLDLSLAGDWWRLVQVQKQGD